jgi:hypothetical protein
MPVVIINRAADPAPPPVGVNIDPDWSNVALLIDANIDVVTNRGYFPDVVNNGFTRNTTTPIEGAGDLSGGPSDSLDISMDEGGTSPDPATGTTWPLRAREWTMEVDWKANNTPLASDTTIHALFSKFHNSGNDTGFLFGIKGDGASGHEMAIQGGTGLITESGTVTLGTLSDGNTYRFALTRSGDDVLVHMDGTYKGKFSFSAGFSFFDSIYEARFGERHDSSGDELEGNFDLMRITEDVARYEELDYDPEENRTPEGGFPDYGNGFQFPRIINKGQSAQTSAAQSHPLTCPFTPTASNLLVLIAAVDGGSNESATIDTGAAGYTEEINHQGSHNNLWVGWKVADGDEDSESPNPTLETNNNQLSGHVWLEIEIPNWDQVTGPEVGTVNGANAQSVTFNSLTLGSANERYLILAVVANDRADTAPHYRAPTDRTWYNRTSSRDASSASANAATAIMSTAVADISSINPSGFQLSATRNHLSVLVAIKHG